MPLDFHTAAMKKNDRSFLLRRTTPHRRYRHMAKLSPETLRERSDHILDAAGRCFARAGFHRTTMQDICREAEVSPGALYIYFNSKEALIAGICERERAEFASRFHEMPVGNDFMGALADLGRQFLEDPLHRRLLCIEVGIEATRNPKVGELQKSIEGFIRNSFHELFTKLKEDGRIAPVFDIDTVVEAFLTIADGMLWRRAVDENFNADVVLPPLLDAVAALLRPVSIEAKL
jgi:TetR/AcrR family transcriptional regulator, repressor for uid operon